MLIKEFCKVELIWVEIRDVVMEESSSEEEVEDLDRGVWKISLDLNLKVHIKV